MDRTGLVVSTEKVGQQTAIIVRGLLEVRVGQHLRRGNQVWTIVKKHWLRKPHVALMLNQVLGDPATPEVDWSLELEYDRSESENAIPAVPDLIVETVVSFSKQTMVFARGILHVSAGDIVCCGDNAWKILDCASGAPAAHNKTWLSIKAEKGTPMDPTPNARLLKKGG